MTSEDASPAWRTCGECCHCPTTIEDASSTLAWESLITRYLEWNRTTPSAILNDSSFLSTKEQAERCTKQKIFRHTTPFQKYSSICSIKKKRVSEIPVKACKVVNKFMVIVQMPQVFHPFYKWQRFNKKSFHRGFSYVFHCGKNCRLHDSKLICENCY